MPCAPRPRASPPGSGGARIFSLFLFLAVLGGAAPARAAQTVILSELAASNTSGLRDEDGAYSDWIELFNSGTNTVDLSGWFLTDSAGDLAKWSFPATNLPPGGFLVAQSAGVAGRQFGEDHGL